VHNLRSELSKEVYAARAACYARVLAKESIEDAIADQLPTAVTKANTLRTMWNSAVSMRDNCAKFTKSKSAESCISATGEMLENLRGFVTPDGVVKAIQNEVFKKALDHHNNLGRQIDQLAATIDKIGNENSKPSNWRQVITRSNSELLNAGWSEEQIAAMRSWERTGLDRERLERRTNEPPFLRQDMVDNKSRNLPDTLESNIPENNQDTSAKLASYVRSRANRHNSAVAKLDKSAKQEKAESATDDFDCVGEGYAANMTPALCRQCKQMVKDVEIEVEKYNTVDTQGSACLAQRVAYKTLKLLVPLSRKCETYETVAQYENQIANLKANNTCNDGIEGPLY